MQTTGTMEVDNCDIDVTSWNAGWGYPKAIFDVSGGGSTFILRNCLFLESSGQSMPFFYGFSGGTCMALFTNNAYQFGYNSNIVLDASFTPISFPAWQSNGYDSGSLSITNAMLNNYVPMTGSSLINAGLNLYQDFSSDYGGNPRPATGPWTIGAYQVASGGAAATITTFFLPATDGFGGTLQLSWPVNDLGWILQTQTNSLNTGLSTNWVDVPGSRAITQTNISVDPAKPMMFYRLRSP